jgi:hypothetical protein
MVFDLNSVVPIVTIIGVASAPTIAAIWAEGRRNRDVRKAAELAAVAAQKVSEVKHTLLETASVTNLQLTQAVERFEAATREIEVLKALLLKERERGLIFAIRNFVCAVKLKAGRHGT